MSVERILARRLYDSELRAWEGTGAAAAIDVAEARRIVRTLIAGGLFDRLPTSGVTAGPAVRAIDVQKGRGRYSSCGGFGRNGWMIRLSPTAGHLKRWVVAHELAHIVDMRFAGIRGNDGHGRRFAGFYVGVTRVVLGIGWANRLAEQFDRDGVRWDARMADDVEAAWAGRDVVSPAPVANRDETPARSSSTPRPVRQLEPVGRARQLSMF